MTGTRGTAEALPPDLMHRIGRRDHAAFRELYDRVAPHLFAIALRILRQRELAEDVVQESFVSIWERAPDYDPERGSAMSWLVTIVRHRAIDTIRRLGARPEGASSGDEALAFLAAGSDTAADRGADRRALDRCLASSTSSHAMRSSTPMPMAIPMKNWPRDSSAAGHHQKLDPAQPRPPQTVSRRMKYLDPEKRAILAANMCWALCRPRSAPISNGPCATTRFSPARSENGPTASRRSMRRYRRSRRRRGSGAHRRAHCARHRAAGDALA